jgi:S1-C subfamily serine protease
MSGNVGFLFGFGPRGEGDRSAPLPPLRVIRDARPRGYIGIITEQPRLRMLNGTALSIRYLDYPPIVSVDPNSPAERAGIGEGDVLLAFNGEDVRDRFINMTRLLEPQHRISITVRRNGEPMDFSVLVARAPATQVERWTEIPTLLSAGTPDDKSARAVDPLRFLVKPLARPEADEGGVSLPAGSPIDTKPLFVFRALDGANVVAGAQVLEVRNEDLARALGGPGGILVLDVAPGPALSSGLRGGDVILAAAGQPVRSIRDLRQRIAERTDQGAIALEIRRAKRVQQLTLRW